MLKNKKVIIVLIIILLILAAAAIVYFLWFKKEPVITIEDKPIQKLFEEKVQGIKYLNKENKIRFLSLESSTFKEFDLNSKQLTELSKIPLYLVKSIIWSPEGKKVILKVENNRALLSQEGYLLDNSAPDGTITTWLFDLSSERLTELPLEIVGIDWLSEDKIIYYYSRASINPEIDPGQAGSSLSESDPDGSNYQKIMDLDESKLYNSQVILSPNKNMAILNPETEGIGKNNIYLVDLKTKKIKDINEGELTIAGSWSTKEDNIFLYQADKDDPGSQLHNIWSANKEGINKKNLQLKTAYPLVITDKDDKFIYLASTYNNNQAIYQVNSGSLEKKIIADTDKEPWLNKITEIGLLNDGIFVVADGKIYSIALTTS